MRYALHTNPWMLMTDSSPVENKDPPDLPVDRQLRYAFGAQYEQSRDLTFLTKGAHV